MLTSKLHCFVKYLCSLVDRFSQDFCNSNSFNETIEMRGNKPMLTSKLYVLLNISGSLMTDFHKTSITVILLMRQSE